MATPVETYLKSVADAIQREDGARVSTLLQLDKAGVSQADGLIDALGQNPDTSSLLAQVKTPLRAVPQGWQAAIAAHLQACCASAAGRHLDALSRCLDCLNSLNEMLSSMGAWIVKPLLLLTREISHEFDRADAEAKSTGRREAHNELTKGAISTLRGSWSACYNHRVPKDEMERSRKMGAIGIAVLLFRLYFRIDQPRQCSFYVQNMERPGMLPPLEKYPLAHAVTYRFYSGRLALFEEKFAQANNDLSFALRHCHKGYPGNARRILEALLPVKLRLGQAPPARLLEQYGLSAAWDGIVAGVTKGDLAAYRTALAVHSEYFIRVGVYLLLQGLHSLVLRTAIKRLARILGTTQIKLPVLAQVLSSPAAMGPHGEALDVDELQCLCAVLISRKLVRGYVSHSPAVLVLAKERAFPKIGDVA